jgi:transcriptional regulator with XRE-family HTH domain
MQHVGGYLKHAREARGLTVQAIASQTKISPHHLEALERGDPLKLPRFYQRAEVRAVAKAVGADEQLALAQLEAELAPVETPRYVPLEPERFRYEYVVAMAGIGVLATALAGWGSFDRAAVTADKQVTPVPVTASPAPPPAAPPAAPLAAPLPSEVPIAPAVETVAAADDVPIAEIATIASASPTELDIWTQPDGARVTVNGIGWGEAPIFIRHLEPGEQRIRVTMDGYAATERSIVLDEGSRQSVSIGLAPE